MKKGFSQIFLMSMIVLVHADLSRPTSGNINGSFATTCGGSVECLIGDELDVAEFPIHSHIGRMLYDVTRSTTGKTGNGNRAAVDCPPKERYRNCLPPPNEGSKQKCGDYTRSC